MTVIKYKRGGKLASKLRVRRKAVAKPVLRLALAKDTTQIEPDFSSNHSEPATGTEYQFFPFGPLYAPNWLIHFPTLMELWAARMVCVAPPTGTHAFCSDKHDLHISLAGMVAASQPLMNMAATLVATKNGQKSSAAKSAAARENGRKGGRPKAVLATLPT